MLSKCRVIVIIQGEFFLSYAAVRMQLPEGIAVLRSIITKLGLVSDMGVLYFKYLHR